MSWFGSIGLAYKYAMIFGGLLLLTILAGFVKVLYDRRRLKKAAEKESLEAGQLKEDLVELNQREKDEGDLFGIRAIEAGFYAGIPQSRPTSRAGSIAASPSISTNTLVGSLASPKVQAHSATSSVTTLPLAHINGQMRDSDNIETETTRRKSPPTIKLRPSQAELNGRINHNAAVNMNLTVPPSPVLARGPSTPNFGSSDEGSIDGNASPRSLSPRSANFRPDHYAPVPPQIPMPEGLHPRVHSPEVTAKSQQASVVTDHSPGHSPGNSAPPSPGFLPQTKFFTVPSKIVRDEPRSLFPAYSERRPSLPKVAVQEVDKQPKANKRPLQPQTHQPSHKRDESSASSLYSDKRTSNYRPQHEHSISTASSHSYNYSFPENSSRNSVSMPPSQSYASGSLQLPETGDKTNDPRFSEFYDAYYRHSQLGVAQTKNTPKRPHELNMTQATIVEVPSPLPSPNPQHSKDTGFAY